MKMLKSTLIFFCVVVFAFTIKAAPSVSTIAINPADSISKPTLANNEKLKLQQMQFFAKMTMADYEKLHGSKLNFFEKLSFKLSQRRANKMLKHYNDGDSPTTLQKISWLFKGILLGPIALLIGYIFLKDEERELIKWIWFGFAGWLVILGIILFA